MTMKQIIFNDSLGRPIVLLHAIFLLNTGAIHTVRTPKMGIFTLILIGLKLSFHAKTGFLKNLGSQFMRTWN